ncbi:C-type mannose receptor 2-like [Puntigrus tetrazona]|uniref:C-type mannose receptor 2-like n=1 Tax=Puntigrus tetrazona TaxID=1606681 RepID=UPI001C89B2FA|nr:C-type mannose receptor 2-like [Puntigrus tetrazona]
MDGGLFVLLLLSGLFWSSSALSRPYFYINTAMSWPDAQSYCRERFTDLATVDNMDDMNRLVNKVDAGYNGSVWIGLKKRTQTRWSWSNGENMLKQYRKWNTGHPNSEGECGCFAFGVWHSYPCSSHLHFVCYSGNTGYIRVQKWKNWTDAQSYCRYFYTDLVTIHNSQEQNQIKSIIPSGLCVWIGLFRDSWEWSDKWSRFFRHWANQPFQSSGSGDCVGMTRTDSGRWSQYSCDLQQPFICYGDDKLNRRQTVRLKLSCNECTMNDPSLQTAILNEISEKLKSMGLESESKISWRMKEDGEVFYQEGNFNSKSTFQHLFQRIEVRPDHQVLACQPQPQTWLQGGAPAVPCQATSRANHSDLPHLSHTCTPSGNHNDHYISTHHSSVSVWAPMHEVD